jgi:hypothetical protein
MTSYPCEPPPSITPAPPPSKTHVETIRELLNGPALLVPCLWGEKRCFEEWGSFALDRMEDPLYLVRLQKGNIGVVLGDASEGLFTIDIDVEEDVEAFLELNPWLRNTLVSKGKRGCNIWLRIRIRGRKCPPSQTLRRNGKKWGEIRANGNQTIIYGKHPDGMRYTWPQECRVLEIDSLDQIQWLPGMQFGRGRNPVEVTHVADVAHVVHEAHAVHAKDGTDVAKVVRPIPPSLFSSLPALPDEIISRNLPVQRGNNHSVLFQLAREVYTFERDHGGKYSPAEKLEIFNRWYERAPKEYLTDSKGDYYTEFLNGYNNVKVAIGDPVFLVAWERAQNATAAPEVMQHFGEFADIKKLACLCKELQREFGKEPFFLSCRKVGELFDVSPKTAWKRLVALEGCGIIKTIEKGKLDAVDGYLASRFRYLLPLD